MGRCPISKMIFVNLHVILASVCLSVVCKAALTPETEIKLKYKFMLFQTTTVDDSRRCFISVLFQRLSHLQ